MLFLTRYPELGASSRYRVYQYLPYLGDYGISWQVQSFMDERLYSMTFQPGRPFSKAWYSFLSLMRRVRAVARHRHFDVVYMQRELLPFGPPLLERWMKLRGTPLIFDIDDALFIKKPSRFNPLATLLRSPRKTLQLFQLVDHVVTGNSWLAERAMEAGGRATPIEVAEQTERFDTRIQSKRASESPVIGWLGSSSTAKYLELIAPVLRRIARRYPNARFVAVGSGSFEMAGVPWEIRAWSLEEETRSLNEFDIGLMPLPDEDWALGKSGGKARTYMAAGVVPVCAGIGYNRQLIEHGRTGFLCTRLAEWYQTLRFLLESPQQRLETGMAAQSEVRRRFQPRDKAKEIARLVREVADRSASVGRVAR